MFRVECRKAKKRIDFFYYFRVPSYQKKKIIFNERGWSWFSMNSVLLNPHKCSLQESGLMACGSSHLMQPRGRLLFANTKFRWWCPFVFWLFFLLLLATLMYGYFWLLEWKPLECSVVAMAIGLSAINVDPGDDGRLRSTKSCATYILEKGNGILPTLYSCKRRWWTTLLNFPSPTHLKIAE